MKGVRKQPKIVFFDLETIPNLFHAWDVYEADALWMERDWRIISFAAKELGKKKVTVYALPDFPLYKKDKHNDRALCKKLWEMMNDADFLIAHNGDRFDIKKTNTRLVVNGFKPPSPYKTIDTLKIAKKYFKFDSNRLDELCRILKIGRKKRTGGKDLWKDCLEGKPAAWKKMKAYNAYDVVLDEKLYLKLRGWHATHPKVTLHKGTKIEREESCPACGSRVYQKRGLEHYPNFDRARHQCKKCYRYFYGPKIKRK